MEAILSNYMRTKEKNLTQRGVIWLGQTCNLRCFFCYFLNSINSASHPQHAFMTLGKAKKICKTLVDFYGNNAIDIQGGEPTIYKDIYELIRYCNEIGLIPTLITNAIVLDDIKRVIRLKESGVRDLLISVQGLGDVYEANVGLKGGAARQQKALENIQEVGIPIRFNVVLNKSTLPQLEEIAKLAIRRDARVVNFIAFNPFVDQGNAGVRNANNVPRYTEATAYVSKAIDILDGAGIEVNVRYYPLCTIEEKYRKNFYNFQQTNYDPHEWDIASLTWTGKTEHKTKLDPISPPVGLEDHTRFMLNQRIPVADGKINHAFQKFFGPYPAMYNIVARLYKKLNPLFERKSSFSNYEVTSDDIHGLYNLRARLNAEMYCNYKYAKKCQRCSLRNICDGFHGDYADFFGFGEAKPIIRNEVISDPRYYISEQEKIVEM